MELKSSLSPINELKWLTVAQRCYTQTHETLTGANVFSEKSNPRQCNVESSKMLIKA